MCSGVAWSCVVVVIDGARLAIGWCIAATRAHLACAAAYHRMIYICLTAGGVARACGGHAVGVDAGYVCAGVRHGGRRVRMVFHAKEALAEWGHQACDVERGCGMRRARTSQGSRCAMAAEEDADAS